MSDLIEFRHLKYIVAVAESANFTRAAERLFLAQPSLSKQIKDLEEKIGFLIFHRTREGVRVTPAAVLPARRSRTVDAGLFTPSTRLVSLRPSNDGEMIYGFSGCESWQVLHLICHWRMVS